MRILNEKSDPRATDAPAARRVNHRPNERGSRMKKTALVICLLLPAAPLLALDAYPMTTIAEVATAVG